MDDRKLLALARGQGHLVDGLIFPSVIAIDNECIRHSDKIALCVRMNKPKGEVIGVIQLEYNPIDQAALDEEARHQKATQHHHDPHNHHHHKHPHFTHTDEVTLKIMSSFLALRLQRFVFQRDVKAKFNDR